MRLNITLKSDLCTSSGENYNAAVDMDVVHDEYGLPYIPAKRLKGLIRESALELVEFGLFSKEDHDYLFGLEGFKNAAFLLDDAHLEKYEQYTEDLKKCKDQVIKHPQRVLNLYTYTRAQTAMTAEGVAKENSLRAIRVVNNGLKFSAQLEEIKPLTKEQKELMEKAISLTKHMGMSRTRGLGMVEMELLPEKETVSAPNRKKYEIYDENQIVYKIRLNGPVLCKTGDGNQEKTEEYIPGDKILGILAELMTDEEFCEFMGYEKEDQTKLIASNAYLYKAGNRCLPIPASYQKKKDQEFENDEMIIRDMLFGQPDGEQRTPFKGGFLSEDGIFGEVETQISYHHKRPKDKAVGRASGEGDSSFYQLKSLCKDQEFSGYLLANQKQAEKIIDLLKKNPEIRIGNGKYTEYGNAQIQILNVNPVREQKMAAKEFVLKLNAAVILYNEYGMPSAAAAVLLNYLEEQLGLEKGALEIRKQFVNYEEIGGFQVTWHRRKPKFTALGKGSVFLISCKKENIINLPKTMFLGERRSEGYGEAAIFCEQKEDVIIRKMSVNEEPAAESYETDLIKRLLIVQRNLELKEIARKIADNEIKAFAQKPEMTAVLGKLILLKKTVPTLAEMKEQIAGIETDKKRKLSEKILSKIEECRKDISKRLGKESTESVEAQTEEILYEVVLPEYLSQLKYLLKTMKEEEA